MAATLTITEALAEIKLIDQKIAKKRDFIRAHAVRSAIVVDPLAKAGTTSEAAIASTLQAIAALFNRRIAIRMAIQQSNLENKLTVEGRRMQVAEWLIWKREVAPSEGQFLTGILQSMDKIRKDAMGGTVQNRSTGQQQMMGPTELHFAIDEPAIRQAEAVHQQTFSRLDALLSVHNSRTTVVIPDNID